MKLNGIFTCEKDLEDYICDHQEDFIPILTTIFTTKYDFKKGNFDVSPITFVGRQVRLGDEHIIDLLYYYDLYNNEKTEIRNYIVVELKFRLLEPKDLAQISRYMIVLREKMTKEKQDYCTETLGLFVSFGFNDEMKYIDMAHIISQERIDYLKLKVNYDFDFEEYSLNDNYIENLKIDDRIEVLEDGKSNNETERYS